MHSAASPAPPTAILLSPGSSARSRSTSSAIPPCASRTFEPVTDDSVFENTTFGSARQSAANSRSIGPASGSRSAVSQYSITSYSRRPRRCAPSSRTWSLWNWCSSSLGADQSIEPSGAATNPSTDMVIEKITRLVQRLHFGQHLADGRLRVAEQQRGVVEVEERVV